MAQNDWVKMAGGIVLGAAVAVALGAVVFDVNLLGDTETGVTLSVVAQGSGCTVSGKETEARVKKSKKLVLKIRNYCTDSAKTVSIGNFRTTPEPVSATDCAAATAGTVVYPFEEQDFSARSKQVGPGEVEGDGSIDPEKATLKLKVKGRGGLGENLLVYYYDICLDGQKSEPRLIVER